MGVRDDMETEGGYGGAMLGDVYDNAQMQPFSAAPAGQAGMPWWESVIAYGATRAIDNRFGPINVGGNTDPGTYGGANGSTYRQRPTQPAPVAPAGPGGVPWLVLLAAGALAFAVLR